MRELHELSLPSPAKINLGLYVQGKRDDGYHNIVTVFQTLEFHDTLHFRRHAGRCALTTDHPRLSVGEDNLIVRAVRLARQKLGCSDNVAIFLEKRIPLGAGLGGGSSNAATTLLGLNRLFNIGASQTELAKLGAELGSDVSFFLYGGTALGTGRGECIRPLPDVSPRFVALVNPGIHISSSWAYKNVNLKLTNFEAVNNVFTQLTAGDVTGFPVDRVMNMFENPVMNAFPVIQSIKATFIARGAEWALMSGSGSTVFGLFKEKSAAQQALQTMGRPDWLVVVTRLQQRNIV